jgi:hypothetical protein
LREPIYNDWPEAAFGPPFSFDSNNLEPVVFEAYGVLGLIAPQRKARRSLAPFGFSSDGAFLRPCCPEVLSLIGMIGMSLAGTGERAGRSTFERQTTVLMSRPA